VSVQELVEHGFADHARRYAGLGWAVIRADGKKAKGTAWQQTAPGEPSAVAGQWSVWEGRYNLGVVCGPSRVAVIDVDVEGDAVAAFKQLLGVDELPATPIVRTGAGGLHVYYADPGGLQKAVRDGFELRVGGHMCLAPPSRHPETGLPYRWLIGHEPWKVTLAPLPVRLREYFAHVGRNGDGAAPPVGDVIPIGAIDVTLTSLAGSMRRRGMSEGAIFAALVAELPRCEPGHTHTEDDCRRIARSIARKAPAEVSRPDRDAVGTRSASSPSEKAVLATASPRPDVIGTRDGTRHSDGIVSFDLEFDEASVFAAEDEAGAAAILGDDDNVVIGENSDVMVYGEGGAGKTTLANDLAVHLAAGDGWLGVPVAGPVRVGIVENEGPRPLFRKKLQRKLDAWHGSQLEGRLLMLRSPWGKVTLADEEVRAALAAQIAAHQLDVVIIGPITRSGMNEAGTLQHVADYCGLIADVRERADRRVTFILIHHENRAGQVSGAWEGAVDTLVQVTGQGNGQTRMDVKKARWGGEYHKRTFQLAWADGESFDVIEGEERDDNAVADEVLAFVLENPGTGWNKISERITGKGDRLRAIRDNLLAGGRLINRGSPTRMQLWHADDPALPVDQAALVEDIGS
jgi:putative DNA primase/helicase